MKNLQWCFNFISQISLLMLLYVCSNRGRKRISDLPKLSLVLLCSQITRQVLIKIIIQWTPSVLIQSDCYFTHQLHSTLQLLKKKKYLTHTYTNVFDVNNHYPQGMDAQGNSIVTGTWKNFHRKNAILRKITSGENTVLGLLSLKRHLSHQLKFSG